LHGEGEVAAWHPPDCVPPSKLARRTGVGPFSSRRVSWFAIPGIFRSSLRFHLGYVNAAMDHSSHENQDEPNCPKCGRKLVLIGSLPKIGSEVRARLFKCLICQLVIRVPPLD
jgi:hypothetical protein